MSSYNRFWYLTLKMLIHAKKIYFYPLPIQCISKTFVKGDRIHKCFVGSGTDKNCTSCRILAITYNNSHYVASIAIVCIYTLQILEFSPPQCCGQKF